MVKGFETLEDLSLPDYFWRRKRDQTVKLVARNAAGIFPEGRSQYKIVDLGTGRGEDLFLLYDSLKSEIRSKTCFIGIDGIPERLETARQTAQAINASGIELILHDITSRLPFEDGSVDFVYCSEVIEHLPSPESLFREIRRILRKDGYFLLTTMNQPNFLEAEYWREKFQGKGQKKTPQTAESAENIMIQGKTVPIYGHISLRTISQWDSGLKQEGYCLIDFARGALRYALPAKLNKVSFLKDLLFFLESLLDIFPRGWTRFFSSQIIGLYQLEDKVKGSVK